MKNEYDFSKGTRGAVIKTPPGKTRITIRIDDDVLDWFRQQAHAAGGGNYQTLINQALRHVVEGEREAIEDTVRRVVREELAEHGRNPEGAGTETLSLTAPAAPELLPGQTRAAATGSRYAMTVSQKQRPACYTHPRHQELTSAAANPHPAARFRRSDDRGTDRLRGRPVGPDRGQP